MNPRVSVKGTFNECDFPKQRYENLQIQLPPPLPEATFRLLLFPFSLNPHRNPRSINAYSIHPRTHDDPVHILVLVTHVVPTLAVEEHAERTPEPGHHAETSVLRKGKGKRRDGLIRYVCVRQASESCSIKISS